MDWIGFYAADAGSVDSDGFNAHFFDPDNTWWLKYYWIKVHYYKKHNQEKCSETRWIDYFEYFTCSQKNILKHNLVILSVKANREGLVGPDGPKSNQGHYWAKNEGVIAKATGGRE